MGFRVPILFPFLARDAEPVPLLMAEPASKAASILAMPPIPKMGPPRPRGTIRTHGNNGHGEFRGAAEAKAKAMAKVKAKAMAKAKGKGKRAKAKAKGKGTNTGGKGNRLDTQGNSKGKGARGKSKGKNEDEGGPLPWALVLRRPRLVRGLRSLASGLGPAGVLFHLPRPALTVQP
eukprot:4718644-Heterocapsa_arctica.AAC.1